MNKLATIGILTVALNASAQAQSSADALLQAYKQSKKVIVKTQTAELCFADTHDCHRVLIGKATPKGTFDLRLYTTEQPGYGGDVVGFKETKDFLFALHRVWTRKPSERRMERIVSDDVSQRIMTNGCINVTDPVYDKLKQYFVLEVI